MFQKWLQEKFPVPLPKVARARYLVQKRLVEAFVDFWLGHHLLNIEPLWGGLDQSYWNQLLVGLCLIMNGVSIKHMSSDKWPILI